MLGKEEIQMLLEEAKSLGAEFAELFFEDKEETNIPFSDGNAQGTKSLRIRGAGLTLINGRSRIYLSTNDLAYESMRNLVKKGTGMLFERKGQETKVCLQESSYPNPCPVLIYPGQVKNKEKLRMLSLADKAARGVKGAIRSLNLNYYDSDQRILVANTEGTYAADRRVNTRVRIKPLVENTKGVYGGSFEYTKAQGFEAFRDEEAYLEFAKDAILRSFRILDADTIKPCTVPVVLAAGGCGTLWHESCGHSLEAIAVAEKTSAFTGKLGEQVASEKVTLIDDGTVPGQYGSGAIDDEGQPRRRNVLIEKGVLKGYLCDRYYGSLIGMESTGSGRRQDYTYAAAPRMTNTFLLEGEDDEEEMIRSVEEGLYVESIGGGYGGSQFSLAVQEGYWIKHGKLDRQVKNIMLTGSGIDVIKRIDRVGTRFEWEGGAFCGASSGLVPTTTPQPMCRISSMAVG